MRQEVETDTSSAPVFTADPPAQELLSNIYGLRNSEELCDVTLSAEGVDFPAHKIVLAGLSPYFKALFSNGFSESNEQSVEIKDVNATSMKQILDFGYGRSFEVTLGNIQNLLQASHFLQVLTLFNQCATFLGANLNAANCLGIHNLAKVYHCDSLVHKAEEYTLKNFSNVSKEEEFLELDAESLIYFISSDSLSIPAEKNEIESFDAVFRWISHREVDRTPYLSKMLAEIRLAHIPAIFLYEVVKALKVVQDSPECVGLLERALWYQTLENRRLELQSPISRRRQQWSTVEVMTVYAESLHEEGSRTVVKVAECGRTLSQHTAPSVNVESFATSSSQVAVYCVHGDVIFFPSTYQTWSSTAITRTGFGLTELDGYLYVIGGTHAESGVSAIVSRYSLSTGTWKTLPSLPIPVSCAGVVTLKGMIYALGGLDNHRQPIKAVQKYNPRSNLWKLVASLPSKKGEYQACAANGQIYACQIFVNTALTVEKKGSRNVYVYNPTTNKWSSCAQLINAFVSGPVHFNGSLFVLTERSTNERILEKYDTTSDSWKEFASFAGYRPRLIGGPQVMRRTFPEYDPKGPLNFIRVLP